MDQGVADHALTLCLSLSLTGEVQGGAEGEDSDQPVPPAP